MSMSEKGRVATVVLLILGIGFAHYSCQIYLVGHTQLHTVLIKLLYVPVLLSAFWWGMRGGGWVGVLCSIIYFVDVLRFWNPEDIYHYNKIADGLMLVGTGLLLGYLVDSDSRSKLARARAEERAETEHSQAITDPLTRCFNRRHMDQKLLEYWQRAKEEGKDFCLMMVDLNSFKEINDTHGHLIGDRVLQSTVKTIHENTRKNDLVFRFGGDEFLVILPKASESACSALARRLIEEMSKLTFYGEDRNPFKASFSVGVIAYRVDLKDMEEMLRKLDEALYRAKREQARVAVAS